eukprot:snap_masked-scaffold_12-processed-gene-2.11-mRNA-1 protein AED:1.00 eAED:1.00 QI:0/0/0/0/1/1/2/0/552
MAPIYIFPLLSLLLTLVNTSAQVPLVAGNFTFLTPRYSNYMGDFEEDCSIIAPMVKLAPGENLCNLDSIETNVTGKVLITFGCYEEIAYENAIELGAVALIDAVVMPPGSYHSVHNAGQSFKKGEVPFLQVGNEFYELFGDEDSSPGFDILDGAQINIKGCADITPVIECYEIYPYAEKTFSLIAVFGIYLAFKAIRRLKMTPSTHPRVALIAYESLLLFFDANVLFFGLSLRQSVNWFDGSIVSAQAKDIFGTLQLVCVIHGSLMNAIYWNALRKGCFLIEAITSDYWIKNFFLSPWQVVALGLSTFIFVEYSRLLVYYYQCDVDHFQTFLRVFITFDILGGIILFLSMTHFILTLRKILPESLKEGILANEKGCSTKRCLLWKNMKGVLLTEISSFRRAPPNYKNMAGINAKLIILSLHLSKWLTLHVILMITAYCLVLFGLLRSFPFKMDQDDPAGCRLFSFYFSYICVRVLLSYCKIIGLAGPSSQKYLEIETEEQEIMIRRVMYNQQEHSNRSPYLRTYSKANSSNPSWNKDITRNVQNRTEAEISL